MGQRKLGAYLDSGSLGLFAQQICEAVFGAYSVAIHDDRQKLIWAGPEVEDKVRWQERDHCKYDFSGVGVCERLDNDECIYVFRLQGDDQDAVSGTISVLARSTHPMSLKFAHDEVRPVIACLERQMSINIELSAVRKISARGQQNLKLLIELDDIDTCAAPEKVLQNILELTAAHFGCPMSAVVLPSLGIQEVYPASLRKDPAVEKPLMATLGSLLSAATAHKRVLLSDTNINIAEIRSAGGVKPKILCAPIINSRDQVTGILALLGNSAFPKESARLVRAICAKVNALTRMANQLRNEYFSRHGLLHHLGGVLQRHANSPHAMLHIDVDKLHVVNDSYGHMAGDEVIRKALEVVDELAGTDDVVAHLSGDRIGLFLRDCSISKATDKAEVVLTSLDRTPVEFDDRTIDITASIGIAMIPDVAVDAADALNIAEVAARSAKERGGNRFVVYQDADTSVFQRRSDLDQVNHLQAALIDDRFVLYAQPIESLVDPEASLRFELLVRMLDENGEIVPPAKFLSAAERYKMMSALDRWVINNAVESISSADNMVEVNLSSFAINVSAQSLTDDDFVDFVADRISMSGVAPDSFCFEITETAIVRNLDRAQRFVRHLRKMGCRLALDDFGTGQCSFAYLKDLPVQFLKIDGVFVRDILENPLSESIVQSVIAIAKVMHAATVAEHVENELVIQRLRQHGIDYAQGFAIGRPKPLADVLSSMAPPILLEELLGKAGEQ